MSALFGPNTAQTARLQAKAAGQTTTARPATAMSEAGSESKKKTTLKPGAGLLPGRAKNARDLRTTYIRSVNAPDGLDPQPMTFPRAVECGHCGWPVFPREAKPATKKTYARAGMETGKKKQADEAAAKESLDAAYEDPTLQPDDEESDSGDTVEELENELTNLREQVADLEQEKETLNDKVNDLEGELKDTKDELKAANEAIAFLEEAEQKWRDKNSQLRTENERLLLYIDRLAARREDLETDLKMWIAETLGLRKIVAKRRRRRNLMLEGTVLQHEAMQKHDVKGLVMRMWRHKAREIKLQRLLRLLEERRNREFLANTANVFNLWQRKIHLDHWVAYLKMRMKDAAHKYLERCLSNSKKPWAPAHAFMAWTGATPVMYLERRLEDRIKEITTTKIALANELVVSRKNKMEVEHVSRERTRLEEVEVDLTDRVKVLEDQLGGNAAAAAEARRLAEKEKEEALRRAVAAVEAKLAAMMEEWESEKEELQMTISNLEGRLAAAEANAGKGGGAGAEDDSWRIVPKGQGVTCVGCLRQLVHRTVQPLPPVTAMKMAQGEYPPDTLDKLKKRFYEEELDGLINPNDEIATTIYMNQKDPYKLSRLNMWPLNVRASKGHKIGGSAANTDMNSTAELSPSSTLKQSYGELPSLDSTMRRTGSRWPKIHPPSKGKDRAKSASHIGLGHKQEAGGMRETFSKDFKRAFR
eukprot:TRINITY_DN95381_c0_g1_i1.p1 TRINITY_DN95381_c0_g1~~TRINITY_DN95381_c0_g1_i1.p1  ORF type:complete len:703 (-),score=174.26 TRINITY_DN95381_c0_g1_i1:66-2174(-)